MRIGIDAHMLGDSSGGNESFFSGLLGAFEPDDKNEYYLFLKQDVDDSLYRDKFRIVRFKSKTAFIRNFYELTKLCIDYKLDVLQTQYYIPFVRPCKTIVVIHDICFERFNNIFRKGEYIRNKLLIPYAAHHADRIITVSEFSKKEISEVYRIPLDKIDVVYNVVDKAFRRLNESERKPSVRIKFDIGNSPYLICVGNLQPRKNIPRLIEAYNKYTSETESSPVKLVVVGKKAWLYDDAFKAAANNPNIILTGYVEREDLVKLLNESKGLIYPSIYEGFGIPPLEACACGVPIAVSDIPVMREVLDGQAIYFDPYDVNSIYEAIKGIVNDRVPEIQPDSLSFFSWKKSAKKVQEIYDKM